jgi:hypothetical protein
MTRKITAAMLENWAGSLATRNLFMNLLLEIINREYDVDQFVKDVATYNFDFSDSEESVNWSEIVEKENICLWTDGHGWEARKAVSFGEWIGSWGDTPQEAVTRCCDAVKQHYIEKGEAE